MNFGRGYDKEFAEPQALSPEVPTDPNDIVLARNSDGRGGIYLEDSWYGAGQALVMLEYLQKHKDWLIEQAEANKRLDKINELYELALQVAKHQRNEDHLQSIETIRAKFWQEVAEFQKETGVPKLAELADITYYAVQEYFQIWYEREEYPEDYRDRDLVLKTSLETFSKACNFSPDQALQIALIKYRLRAEKPGNKNEEAEYAAIAAYIDR